MKLFIFVYVVVSLTSCRIWSPDLPCIEDDGFGEMTKIIFSKIDSTQSNFEYEKCRKYRFVRYDCDESGNLQVEVKTKCDTRFFLFDKESNLIKVTLSLDPIY